jgi:CRISPR type IV-associated protein Csf3
LAADDTMIPLERWLQLLTAEHARRQGVDGDALERLLDQLAEMGKRLRAGPGRIEPTPAEQAQSIKELDRWFRERHGRN